MRPDTPARLDPDAASAAATPAADDWPAALAELAGPAAGPPEPLPDASAWRAWWRRWSGGQAANASASTPSTTPPTTPATLALRAGMAADRMAWAMAGGYQAALRALLPGRLRPEHIAGFSVTEAAGNRPRDLQALALPQPDGGWRLRADKRWATLAPVADGCVVVARDGRVAVARDGGTAAVAAPALRAWWVPTDAPGVSRPAMPATRFAPELPHAALHLADVVLPASALLPGDGWDDFGKPFRTQEDGLVMLALLAHALRQGRARGWPPAWCEQVLGQVAALGALADGRQWPVQAAATHLALAGALATARALLAQTEAWWAAHPDDPVAQRWLRDRPLLEVAGTARAQRAARAWQRVGGAPGAAD